MKSFLKNSLICSYCTTTSMLKLPVYLAITISVFIGSASANNQWQPVASDTLIKLPAKVIHQRVQSDFSSSPLAQRLNVVEQNLSVQANQIKSLITLKKESSSEQATNIDFDIVEKKSSYLGLLKESHDLRQQALNKRQNLYENILGKITKQFTKQKTGDNYQVKAAQKAAQARMKGTHLKVEQTLNQYQGSDYAQTKKNKYQRNYQTNLDKINQLKETLAKHSFNEKPEVDGVVLSDKEYIRTLLMKLASEQSLLDQENTMLAYMTKLVALDAESLTVEIAKTTQTATKGTAKQYTKAYQATDLFINGEYNE